MQLARQVESQKTNNVPSQLPPHLVFVVAAVSIWKKYVGRDAKKNLRKP
jgi:hypothetical protein